MNCAALPETLIEAELFGHEAGAFTGATRARAGRFEEADGGTLFLDELGTLSMAAQERLLRVVEYGEVTRIGASRPVHRKCTHRCRNQRESALPASRKGQLPRRPARSLSFEVITLPPLRARDGDVAVLADHFGRRMASEIGWLRWPGFSDAVMAAMEAYRWPGNVRELRNVVERAVYRWQEEDEPVDSLTFDPFASPWAHCCIYGGSAAQGGKRSTRCGAHTHCRRSKSRESRKYERSLVEEALVRHRHNQRAAAKALKLSYDQFRHCLRKHGLLQT
jgi:psp operon transcriptional activator